MLFDNRWPNQFVPNIMRNWKFWKYCDYLKNMFINNFIQVSSLIQEFQILKKQVFRIFQPSAWSNIKLYFFITTELMKVYT